MTEAKLASKNGGYRNPRERRKPMKRWKMDWDWLMNAIETNDVHWNDVRDVVLDIIFWLFR